MSEVIQAHARDVSRRPGDPRGQLIEHWKHFRSGRSGQPALDLAIQLVEDGTVNEVELGFHVMMDLALTSPSFQAPLRSLALHPSAKVRRSLAFYLSGEFAEDFRSEVYRTLLKDKAASVRVRAIQVIGMQGFESALEDLRTLRSVEKQAKVVEALDFWLPLLEHGYRIAPSGHPGRLKITALVDGGGISSRTLETKDPCDPRIPALVAELRRPAWLRKA